MSDGELSFEAYALLKQLRANPTVGHFDASAAGELVARGFAVAIPGEGILEITEAGRYEQMPSGGDDLFVAGR